MTLKDMALTVSHLNLSLLGGERKEILSDISFVIPDGETLVILGESGSGKTLLTRALTGLLPPSSFHLEGSVRYSGQPLLTISSDDLRKLRRNTIRYVFQEPLQALNPVARIHEQMRLAASDDRVQDQTLLDSLATVGISNGEEVLNSYPHELSVGMAQRVAIAMALLPDPELLIADEPTSAVDPSLKYQIMDLLVSIRRARGISLLLVTHDLDIAGRYGDRIVVLYRGRIVEIAPSATFIRNPLHPYSRMLLESRPDLTVGKSNTASEVVRTDSMREPDTGCRFSSRCPRVQPLCKNGEPSLERADDNREVRCLYWK